MATKVPTEKEVKDRVNTIYNEIFKEKYGKPSKSATNNITNDPNLIFKVFSKTERDLFHEISSVKDIQNYAYDVLNLKTKESKKQNRETVIKYFYVWVCYANPYLFLNIKQDIQQFIINNYKDKFLEFCKEKGVDMNKIVNGRKLNDFFSVPAASSRSKSPNLLFFKAPSPKAATRAASPPKAAAAAPRAALTLQSVAVQIIDNYVESSESPPTRKLKEILDLYDTNKDIYYITIQSLIQSGKTPETATTELQDLIKNELRTRIDPMLSPSDIDRILQDYNNNLQLSLKGAFKYSDDIFTGTDAHTNIDTLNTIIHDVFSTRPGWGGLQATETLPVRGTLADALKDKCPQPHATININTPVIIQPNVSQPPIRTYSVSNIRQIRRELCEYTRVHSYSEDNTCLVYSFLNAICPAYRLLDEAQQRFIGKYVRYHIMFKHAASLVPLPSASTINRINTSRTLEDSHITILSKLYRIGIVTFEGYKSGQQGAEIAYNPSQVSVEEPHGGAANYIMIYNVGNSHFESVRKPDGTYSVSRELGQDLFDIFQTMPTIPRPPNVNRNEEDEYVRVSALHPDHAAMIAAGATEKQLLNSYKNAWTKAKAKRNAAAAAPAAPAGNNSIDLLKMLRNAGLTNAELKDQVDAAVFKRFLSKYGAKRGGGHRSTRRRTTRRRRRTNRKRNI